MKLGHYNGGIQVLINNRVRQQVVAFLPKMAHIKMRVCTDIGIESNSFFTSVLSKFILTQIGEYDIIRRWDN